MAAPQMSEIFKALGDPTRLGILQLLTGKEMCVCEILEAFDKSQPAISHHLKIMKQAGLLRETREGKWIMYSIDSAVTRSAAALLGSCSSDSIERIEPRRNPLDGCR